MTEKIKCKNCGAELIVETTKQCVRCGWYTSKGGLPFEINPPKDLLMSEWDGTEEIYCFPPFDGQELLLLKKKAGKTYEAFRKFLKLEELTEKEKDNIIRLKRNKYLKVKCKVLKYIKDFIKNKRTKVTEEMIQEMIKLKKEGRKNDEIGMVLGVSGATVATYLSEHWEGYEDYKLTPKTKNSNNQ